MMAGRLNRWAMWSRLSPTIQESRTLGSQRFESLFVSESADGKSLVERFEKCFTTETRKRLRCIRFRTNS